jgi:hypothetical protein
VVGINEFMMRRLRQMPAVSERIRVDGNGRHKGRFAYVSRVEMGQSTYTRVEVGNDVHHFVGSLIPRGAANKGFNESRPAVASQAGN